MNEFKHSLVTNLSQITSLKQELDERSTLLAEKPVDPDNILDSMHDREQSMDLLVSILPKLSRFNIKRI